MPKEVRGLVERLRRVEVEIRALEVGDKDSLVRICASLEEAIRDIPEEMTLLIELLNLCLEGMRGLCGNVVTNPRRLADALAGAVAAAERFLISGDKPGPL